MFVWYDPLNYDAFTRHIWYVTHKWRPISWFLQQFKVQRRQCRFKFKFNDTKSFQVPVQRHQVVPSSNPTTPSRPKWIIQAFTQVGSHEFPVNGDVSPIVLSMNPYGSFREFTRYSGCLKYHISKLQANITVNISRSSKSSVLCTPGFTNTKQLKGG